MESPQQSRGLVVVRKPDRKPARVDRLALWLSKGRQIDGLWVGSWEHEVESYPALRRVEDALQLIKRHAPLYYSRVIRDLDRIWVNLIPGARAQYEGSLNACVLDERYVLEETMTLERLASTIVHEATHARLERWGILYEEKLRHRIESICLRRELDFAASLPDSASLREEITRTLDWCASEQDYFSDASFRGREDQEQVETLRHLNVPSWLLNAMMWFVRRRRQRTASSPKSTA
ncbi:hypothetical protein JQ604_32780 [Bradyrhizobium jicamae]|uniref:hypothetical protein n=1 Tax=Bradyrhizobium jicamae TaxID=280332 RepID=UPI001BAC67F3|nr:hypothetical protein [Bradyrhizobium jicamae]MBR0756982.1 hypothetical protein [Bradyrhizobium jicamae]